MARLLRRLAALAALGLVGLIAVAVAGVVVSRRRYVLLGPPITADRTPEGVRLGAALFAQACADCHVDPDSGVATGHRLLLPAAFGRVYASNLTSDPDEGIGRFDDRALARAVRVGVGADGRALAIMPRLPGLADADAAALIGYLRSGAPPLRPGRAHLPRTELTVVGKVIAALWMAPTPEGARAGVGRPPKGLSVAYGRYLADEVDVCWNCHTEGPGRAKRSGPRRYAGGFRFGFGADAMVSSNITPDPSGIGAWTRDELARALREGVAPGGVPIRFPMVPRRTLDDVDAGAIYLYLRTVPKVATGPRERPSGAGRLPPERLFAALGCERCHGEGKPLHDRLRRAAGRPVDEVARWIREPQRFRPDSAMPSFAGVIDEAQARALAAWIQRTAAQRGSTTVRR